MVNRYGDEFVELVLTISFAIGFHSFFHFFIIDFIFSIFIDEEWLQFILTKVPEESFFLILWLFFLFLLYLLWSLGLYFSFFFTPKEYLDEQGHKGSEDDSSKANHYESSCLYDLYLIWLVLIMLVTLDSKDKGKSNWSSNGSSNWYNR